MRRSTSTPCTRCGSTASRDRAPDVRVRVHIGGTLSTPTAELSSPDSARVTNAELISYLVTGYVFVAGAEYVLLGR